MAYLELRSLRKTFGANTVVSGLDLDIAGGEFVSLLGPSGCGKTTTLRLIAGFEKPDAGSVRLGGEVLGDTSAHKRNIGMVFQSYALFPHLTVEKNIAYGLEQRRLTRGDIRQKVRNAVEMVRLDGLEQRLPGKLSGGQQQRVALARALVIEPRLLLLDESLSALDKKLRVEMQAELRQIQRRLKIATLFVTHDKEEALTLSDRIAVMRDGEMIQQGVPKDIYERPRNRFVAGFLGSANFFEGDVAGDVGGVMELRTESGVLYAPVPASEGRSGRQIIGVRPERVNISVTPPDGPHVQGRISFITYVGNVSTYRIETALGEILAETHCARDGFAEGERVFASWLPQATLFLEAE